MYVPVTSGPDFVLAGYLQARTQVNIVCYSPTPAVRAIYGVYRSQRRAVKAAGTLLATDTPLVYVAESTGLYMLTDSKGNPL